MLDTCASSSLIIRYSCTGVRPHAQQSSPASLLVLRNASDWLGELLGTEFSKLIIDWLPDGRSSGDDILGLSEGEKESA